MTSSDLAGLLAAGDPFAIAALLPPSPEAVTFSTDPPPGDWLVDGDAEGDLARHRSAHREGRPSEAAVAYGADVPLDHIADRLSALAELSAETGMLRAVQTVPADGDRRRPGSWGVEDLVVVAAARLALPGVPWIRPHWGRLGPGACQVAVAFGATDWQIPPGDPTDPAVLAAAVGRTAVRR